MSYRLRCRKNTENENQNVITTKNGTIMLLLKCAVCNSKKPKFIKEQEAKWVLSNLTAIKVQILRDLSIIKSLF